MLGTFKRYGIEEARRAIDSNLSGDGTVYYRISGDFEIVIGHDYDQWVCDISDDEGLIAQNWGRDPESALLRACVELYASDAIEQGNLEDAVNFCAYSAAHLIENKIIDFGHEFTVDAETVNAAMGCAIELFREAGAFPADDFSIYD